MLAVRWGPPRVSELELVAEGMRAADLLELREDGYTDPFEALAKFVKESDKVALIYDEVSREPVAVFGLRVAVVDDDAGALGCVWLLGTDAIRYHRSEFLRRSRDVHKLLCAGCSATGNLVHRSNSLHIRWLRWLGYTLSTNANRNKLEFYRLWDSRSQR
jgi:hypothetical protein